MGWWDETDVPWGLEQQVGFLWVFTGFSSGSLSLTSVMMWVK